MPLTRRSKTNQGISRRRFVAAAGAAVLSRRAWAKPSQPAAGVLRAGAAAVDITPTQFPVIVNGGFLERRADKAHWSLHARCLV